MNSHISNSNSNDKKILIVGDVFFKENDTQRLIDKVRNELNDYIVLANLEGSINLLKNKSKKSIPLSLPNFNPDDMPSNLYFSIVNNHVTDFGIENFFKNIEHLKNKIIYPLEGEIHTYINNKKFIFLADKKEQCILRGTNFLSFSNKGLKEIYSHLKDSHVIIHGGIEYRKHPSPYQRSLARKIIESGASSVIFHHSHVVGNYEYWQGKLIHYGLGNAFFSDTLNLHKLEESISQGVVIGNSISILKLNILTPDGIVSSNKEKKLYEKRDYDYKKFYKNKYKLESSFRPRQLFLNDMLIDIQYFFWSMAANFFVKNKLSKPIKSFLNNFIKN